MNQHSKDVSFNAVSSKEVGFVHLHVHSSYSLLEGALTVPVAGQARGGRPAAGRSRSPTATICSGDWSSRTSSPGGRAADRRPAAWGSFRACRPDRPHRPRPPAALDRASGGLRGRLSQPDAAHEPRLARHVAGRRYCVSLELLTAEASGLIALTGGPRGPLDTALREGRRDLAASRFEQLAAAFGDRLYVGAATARPRQERQVEPELIRLAYEAGVPLVATNETYFAKPDDYEAHDALLAIADGRLGRRREPPPADTETRLQEPRRDGQALRRPARGARVHRRRSPCGAPSGPRRASRSCRASRKRGRGEGDVDEAAGAAPTRQRRARRAPCCARAGTGPAEADYTSRLELELSVIARMNIRATS